MALIPLIAYNSAYASLSEKINYSAQDDYEIRCYLDKYNLNAEKSDSGLYYIIDEEGTGASPLISDRVKVSYRGYFTNGTIFDESSAEGISFYFPQVIPGWQEGIRYFREGGSGKLFIPSRLGYGNKSHNRIPGGSVLIFDIKLIYVNYNTENDLEIQKYISDNNLKAYKSTSGLYVTMDVEGHGKKVTSDDNVTITYIGILTDNTIFAKSLEKAITFNLDEVLGGWKEGLTYFKQGGSGKLLVPSHMAYGNKGTDKVPGGAVTIYHIHLISVN